MSAELVVLDPRDAYALWAADYPAHAHNAFMQAEERAMLSLLPADLQGGNVLDAGCGSGRYLLHAKQRGAGRVLGIDFSPEMLKRARKEIWTGVDAGKGWLIQAGIDAIPLRDGWADLTLCALTIGHLESLESPLSELCRVTRPGGTLLISDFHPEASQLGWKRTFKAGGQSYAIRHTPHFYCDWQRVCQTLPLQIVRILEPSLEAADIPPGAVFDSGALAVPVALVIELRREEASG